jgi:hypothetical protein
MAARYRIGTSNTESHAMKEPTSPKNNASAMPDALDALINQQNTVHRLFKAFDEAADDADPAHKVELAKAICREISAKTRNAGEES